MSLPRYAAKRDVSEPEIVSALEQCGFSVERLDKPVDLLVGFRGRMWLIECKSSDKGYGKALNRNQKKFSDRWRGTPVVILRSAQDAIDWAVSVASEAA
jgi:Holliday junction resolvase